MNKTLLTSLITLTLIPLLSACSPGSIVAGGVAGGGLLAAQERNIGTAASDFAIQTKINDLWFRQDVESFGKLDITVNKGRVLLTGVVQDPDQRLEAVRLAWQPEGVKQVINEIRVGENSGVKGLASDTWISTQLRTRYTFDEDILSVNYSVDTVDGIVYLLGTAQSRDELNRATEIAQTVSGVQKVVSYVEIAEAKTERNENTLDAIEPASGDERSALNE